MTIEYETAVIIISLALFGIYCLIEELRTYTKHSRTQPTVSILLIVQNAQHDIEQLVRTATQNLSGGELIIIDIASNDMTRPILAKLSHQHNAIRIIHRSTEHNAIADNIAAARGNLICICDTIHRMTTEECLAALNQLAKTT